MAKQLISIDRKELDNAIEEMSLFTETKKVITEYEKEESKLDERQEHLNTRLSDLMKKQVNNFQEQQVYRNVDDLIYLQLNAKEINNEIAILETLLEELKEEYQKLKLKFAPAFKDASSKDSSIINMKYGMTAVLEQVKYDLLTALMDLKKGLDTELQQVSKANEVLMDKQVNEKYRTTYNVLSNSKIKPVFSYPYPYLINRNEVWAACDGSITMNNPRKEVEND
ncbi:hypothetical protein V7201_02215 [Bacillus sp. JJ1122]|uniref:hypothetical protein n=1 Tax=Bacillus sp. JJ1122 TaxID=3122951 RepID=UPI002FFE303C